MKHKFGAILGAIAITACALLAQPAAAHPTDDGGASGAWWNGLDQAGQRTAVTGLYQGFIGGAFDTVAAEADRLHVSRSVMLAKIGRPEWSRTIAYYAAGITDFYATHPNADHAPIVLVFGCLRDGQTQSACDHVAKAFNDTP